MKFLLIDDHVLIREALLGVLKDLRRDAPSWKLQIAIRRSSWSRSTPISKLFCWT